MSALAASLLTTSSVYAESINKAFQNGEVSGQVRLGYINFNPDASGEKTQSATAAGGQLKYETAKFYGFDAGVAFYTSHDIPDLSGDRGEGKRNEELASSEGHYSVLAESYLDYSYDAFTVRVGRQLIDTPYADSDDIRMTPNTFEGAVASYGLNDFTFIGAYLTRWQGPDSESEYEFVDLVGGDGVAMLAATYASDMIEAGAWYYGADKAADVIYADAIATMTLEAGATLSVGLQFADQSEKSRSGYDATLYGAMAEVGHMGLTLGVAYDTLDVADNKSYFGGFGGGVAFVNMDETTIGTMEINHDVEAWELIIAYDFSAMGVEGLSVEYDYGMFDGDHQHLGVGEKDHEVTEQDIIISYAPSESWDADLIYCHFKDENQNLAGGDDYSFNRLLVRANYNF